MSKARMFPRTTEQVVCSIWTSPALLHSGPGPQCSCHVGDLLLWKHRLKSSPSSQTRTQGHVIQGTAHTPCAAVLSSVWLFVTPQTIVRQAPLSVEFSRQEFWSRLPFPTPGGLPDPGMEPESCVSCICRWDLYHLHHPGNPSLSSGVPRHEAAVLITLYLRSQFKSSFKI